MSTEERVVYWSADVIDVTCDVENRHEGQACRSGYVIDPEWSLAETAADPDGGEPDVMPADETEPGVWLGRTIHHRIGLPENVEPDGAGSTWYSADVIEEADCEPCGGVGALVRCEVRLAAHAHGFTPEEITGAVDFLGRFKVALTNDA